MGIASAHLLEEAGATTLFEPLAVFGKVAAAFRGRKPSSRRRHQAATVLRFGDLAVAFSSFSAGPLRHRGGRGQPLRRPPGPSRPRALPVLQAQGGRVRPAGRSHRPAAPAGDDRHHRRLGEDERRPRHPEQHPQDRVRSGERGSSVKPGPAQIEGCRRVPSIGDLPGTVDLFVLTLGAEQSADVMKDLVDHGKARSVIIIAGGMGEKGEGGASIRNRIREHPRRGPAGGRPTPVLNGGNCLGIVSKPGHYDTTFIPATSCPVRTGRFGDGDDQPERRLHDLPDEQAAVDRARLFRFAGQSDRPDRLGLPLGFSRTIPTSRRSRLYGGLQARRRPRLRPGHRGITASGRTVLVYKAGRSPEGRSATSSHTASVRRGLRRLQALRRARPGPSWPRASSSTRSFHHEGSGLARGADGPGPPGRPRQQRRVRMRHDGRQPQGRLRGRAGRVRPRDEGADPGEPPAARHRQASSTSTIPST